ncbi:MULTISPECIES: helix-turn-helix transcriptional regulator [Salinicola]|jgi:DNA-binding transcriptional regulator YiaG|uniref:helix-turn-helix domain-containing protein n=1 Tax=Salinicola TaxID=404432 RepID=UPI0009F1679E|nr:MULTISPECIES: helix-turn-helix transcriptional regulator [Salinicola]MDF3919760.1 helix-turn-helix transcriptional regulator [Salinicola salarius]MEC8918861.1 helix-turn-helix transcriptional regulator [Pseudomonadota bacterium]MED5499895.1 helix-turn-helix transcriptional regulator [Pseudomonadota bacterium]
MDGLGPRIKQLRLQAGMSKAALARRVGVSDVTISYWESGTIKQIGHERLVALTSALCCSIKQLLDDDSLNAMAAASRTSGGTVLSLQANLAAPWEQREDEPGEMSTLQMLTQDCHLVTPAENESFDFLFEGDLAAIAPCDKFQQDGLYLLEREGLLQIQYLEHLASGRMRVSGEQLQGATVESVRHPPFRIVGYIRARWCRQ